LLSSCLLPDGEYSLLVDLEVVEISFLDEFQLKSGLLEAAGDLFFGE